MKISEIIKKAVAFCVVFVLFSVLNNSSQVSAQPQPPVNPEDQGVPIGGSAPVDGGIVMMIVPGILYGIKKYRTNNSKEEIPEE